MSVLRASRRVQVEALTELERRTRKSAAAIGMVDSAL